MGNGQQTLNISIVPKWIKSYYYRYSAEIRYESSFDIGSIIIMCHNNTGIVSFNCYFVDRFDKEKPSPK